MGEFSTKLDDHLIEQKNDGKFASMLTSQIEKRVDRLESIHEKEDAVKALISKWAGWFYNIFCALLGVLASEAFRRLPIKFAIFSASAIAASVLSASAAQSATYYVSPSGSNTAAGTLAAPWATLAYAATRVTAGDTVTAINGGTYNTSVRFTISGTANSRITFKADPAGSVRVVPPVNNSAQSAIEVAGNYITFTGFVIDGSGYQSGNGWSEGIKITGTNVHVENNEVKFIGYSAKCNQNVRGIYADQTATNVKIAANTVHDIELENCRN